MGGRSGQSISSGGASFQFSHSFINDAGNRVSQYNMIGGYGGYARIEHDPTGFVVTNIIIDERARNRGLATKLYKKINKLSLKETGKTLQSIKKKDGVIELSSDGERLWKSLVNKGLAKKISERRYRFI